MFAGNTLLPEVGKKYCFVLNMTDLPYYEGIVLVTDPPFISIEITDKDVNVLGTGIFIINLNSVAFFEEKK